MITSRCTECGAESSGSGGISHASTCSAVSLTPKLQYGQMVPAIELKFGSKAERKKFMANLNGSSGGTGLRLDDPEATIKDTVTSPKGSTIEDKLNNHPALLAHYWGKDWLETYGEYPKWESLDSVQQEEITELLNLITTETTKAAKKAWAEGYHKGAEAALQKEQNQ